MYRLEYYSKWYNKWITKKYKTKSTWLNAEKWFYSVGLRYRRKY